MNIPTLAKPPLPEVIGPEPNTAVSEWPTIVIVFRDREGRLEVGLAHAELEYEDWWMIPGEELFAPHEVNSSSPCVPSERIVGWAWVIPPKKPQCPLCGSSDCFGGGCYTPEG